MDRTVYYNLETCSTYSDDSYQKTPQASVAASKERSVNFLKSQSQSQASFFNKNSQTSLLQKRPSYQSVNSSRLHHQQSRSSTNPPVSRGSIGFPRIKKEYSGALTKKVIQSGISRVAIPSTRVREDELEYQYGSVLVLHLQCKNIKIMTPGALDPFYSLKNLYLYKNNIRRIEGLDRLENLELLDLSRNNVERIDNLDNCKKLKQLYLGFNEVQIVEGLESLENLEELHLDDQDIPPEQPIIFSPGIMSSVAASLLHLDLSSNQLSSLAPIANLPVLDTLLAADNLLEDIEEVLVVLQSLRNLRILNLKGNAIASKPTYKSRVIGIVCRLEVLDDKDVNDTTRACLQKLRLMKEYRARQKEEADLLKKLTSELNVPDISNTTDLSNSSEFTFSTPTNLSPLPPKPPPLRNQNQPVIPKRKSPAHGSIKSTPTPLPSDNEESPRRSPAGDTSSSGAAQLPMANVVFDSKFYESTARNPAEYPSHNQMDMGGGGDQMSDMAKIIFRLSNLDDEKAMKYSNYWDAPGSSMLRECRPLSPLEGLDPLLSHSSSAPEVVVSGRYTSGASGNRPKPASIQGRQRSNNNGAPSQYSSGTMANSLSDSGIGEKLHKQQTRYYYGRTLSPLMELPTPDSLTARDAS